MSEKIYAWLLRLYPAHFRKPYHDAALQLVRDRFRDERGFFPRLRLWLDLLHDLAVSIPRAYSQKPAALRAAPLPQPSGETLSFQVLQAAPPRLEAIFFGGVLSLAAVGAFAVAIGHAGSYKPFRAFVNHPHSPAHVRPTASRNAAEQTYGDAEQEAIGSGAQPTAPPSAKARNQTTAQAADKPSTVITADASEIDAAEQQRVIHAAVVNLKQHYIDPQTAQQMADVLLAHAKHGDDAAVQTGAGFAALLTTQMRDVSHDLHLVVAYSHDVLPPQSALTMSSENLIRYRQAMQQSNCTFDKVAVLPHNIGYLKLDSFPEPSVCQSTATAAMARLNNADAIIFDLRDNRGGFGEMVSLLAAYLFEHPAYMYDPRQAPNEQSWTRSPVPGNKLANKPVYILTSATTISAAEQFSYDLKMLKRATLVGETTGGSAHAGVFHRIDDHFGMGIPEVKVVNPYAKNDWEGTGILPDVKVKAADALETAEKLAQSRLAK